MESLLKNLEKHITCSICLDTFTKPKTIACLHTFCLKCLEKHALTTQRQGQFRCPECQAQVNIPQGNRFDNLPTGFLQNSLLSLLAVRQSGDGSETSCGSCRKTSAEISYCFDCGRFLCPDCVNAHELLRNVAFQGHKVTPVKQFQPADYEALLKRQSFCCQLYHEREVTRFFCLECQICVCQLCIVTDHKNHTVDPLEKAADSEKGNIMAGAELMKEKRKVCSDVIREYENTALKLDTNISAAKREVSQAAEQMIAKIREHEGEAITILENTRVSRMEKLNSVTKQVQSLTKQLDQAVEFSNNLLQRSSSSDIMQSKKNLEQRFHDLNKTPVPALPVSSLVKFASTIAPESLSLGFVLTSETDVQLSTVKGLSENFQAGLEAEFVVCPKLKCDGELTSEAQPKFHVEVLVEPAKEVASLIILQNEEGNFQVKFIPKVPGTYNITVKINGDKLVNSPFTVQVKERRIDVVGELDLEGEIPRQPRGIAVNGKGQIAISDGEKNCVLLFDCKGKFVRRLGCSEKNAGSLNRLKGIAYLNNDEILVADDCNDCIQQFNVQTGNFVKSLGKEGTGDGEFKSPLSVCMDGDGHVVVTDFCNNRIQVLTKDGKPVLKFGDSGPGKLNRPGGCIYHKNMFIVSDSSNDCLQVFDSSGKFLYEIGEEGEADGQFSCPWGSCVEKYGNRENLLVCDSNNGRIQQFTVEGRFTGKTVTKLQDPTEIATTPDGRIFISDWKKNKIYVLK